MKKNKVINFMFGLMLAAYIILLVDLLFFRPGYDSRTINIIPFQGILENINFYDGAHRRTIGIDIWANILLFIPTGIYSMILIKNKIGAYIFLLVVSLIAELVQYIFAVGICDIDDVILYCIGGIIGTIIYILLQKVLKTREKTKEVITWISSAVGIPTLVIVILLYSLN